MPKDTKSSGYNKAPACESRGFGHKKEGENFDTPSLINYSADSTDTLKLSQSSFNFLLIKFSLLLPPFFPLTF